MKNNAQPIAMDEIFQLDAKALQKRIGKYLRSTGRKYVQTDDFLYYEGEIPVLLVAHLDTVHTQPPTICKSGDGNIWMAPQGIGGDDRCGVSIILSLLETYDCHMLFTQGEEIGGIGAHAFVKSGIVPKVNFMVQIDRQGKDDAVFYNCGNDNFIDFVLDTTGYTEAHGSFSDISVLSPAFDLASVNLSSGYFSPHDNAEFIILSDMDKTREVTAKLIDAMDRDRVFRYEKSFASYGTSWGKYGGKYDSWKYFDSYDDYYEKRGDISYLPSVKPADSYAKPEKTSFDRFLDEEEADFYSDMAKQMQKQNDEDDFKQLIFDETELYVRSITGYMPDAATTEMVAYQVEQMLMDQGYLPMN